MVTGLHDALAALAAEHRAGANPAPYTSELALIERLEALLIEHVRASDLPVATDSTTAERDAWQNGLPVFDMSQQELDALLDYSTSLPTGKTIGKRWKRRLFAGPKAGAWVLGEYAEDPNPDRVAIVWHEIRVLPPAPEPSDRAGHDFLPVNGHPDDDECTHRADGTDTSYCGKTRAEHDTEPTHHPNCYQSTGAIPDDLPADLCDCRVLRMIDAASKAKPSDRAGLSEDERAANTALSVWSTTCHAYCSEEDRVHSPECLLAAGLHRSLADRLAVAEQETARLARPYQPGTPLVTISETEWEEAREAFADVPQLQDSLANAAALAEAAEQEAATLRSAHERTQQSLRQSEQTVANLRETEVVLRGEIRRSESAIAKVEEIVADRDALRAQVAAVERLHEDDGDGWCGECGCVVAECSTAAALGDPGPWVDRLKTEARATELKQAAVESLDVAFGSNEDVRDWLDERARVLRDGEPTFGGLADGEPGYEIDPGDIERDGGDHG